MRKKCFSSIIICCGLICAATAHAKTDAQIGAAVNHCVGLLKSKHYQSAFSCFDVLSKQGISQAKFNMAFMYDEGLGVKKDAKKAFALYQEVARESGNTFAQAKLGEMYLHGTGVKQDCKKAHFWLTKSAATHNPWATEDLAQWKAIDYHCPAPIQSNE